MQVLHRGFRIEVQREGKQVQAWCLAYPVRPSSFVVTRLLDGTVVLAGARRGWDVREIVSDCRAAIDLVLFVRDELDDDSPEISEGVKAWHTKNKITQT